MTTLAPPPRPARSTLRDARGPFCLLSTHAVSGPAHTDTQPATSHQRVVPGAALATAGMVTRPSNPLVVTLKLDSRTHAFLTRLRTEYFPPERNYLDAHVTLFHAIPPSSHHQLDTLLASLTRSHSPFPVRLGEPFSIGRNPRSRGVAIPVMAPALSTLHDNPHLRHIQEQEHPHHDRVKDLHRQLLRDLRRAGVVLTPQDGHGLGRAHVTVCNKAPEEVAEACLSEVGETLAKTEELDGVAEGLSVFEYEHGGTWKWIKDWIFDGSSRKP